MHHVVETALGRFRGSERRGVLVFRGVPFARPPVATRRLRPPEPPLPFAGVRDATERGAAAPQPAPRLPGPLGAVMGGGALRSEDCLTLSVVTPGLDDARRPVLVWIHGGGFAIGSGATPVYSGRRLAAGGDVVVVTINYRLGALGFLHLGLLGVAGYEESSNLGIQDQIAALRFVREHARAFGGDPDNVTIFGESAGAMSVATLLGVPAARGLFHRAIAQSGAAHNVSSAERGAAAAETFLRELGATARSAPEAIARASAEQILDAQLRTTFALGLAHGSLPWQPVVDGRLVPRQPLDAVAAGEASGIPLLLGTNRDEWKLFTLFDRRTREMDAERLRRRLERMLPGKDEDGAPLAERALEVYRGGRSGASPLALWEAIQTDRIFRYPAARLAEVAAGHERRSYAYLFEWTPRIASRRIGACHGLEVPFVFGTLAHPVFRALVGAGGRARELSRAMRAAWVAFARGGEPSAPALPAWRPYDAHERATMVLGPRSQVVRAPYEEERRFWDALLAHPG